MAADTVASNSRQAITCRLALSSSTARSVSRTWLGALLKSCCSRISSVSSRQLPLATDGACSTALKLALACSARTSSGASMRAGVSTHS